MLYDRSPARPRPLEVYLDHFVELFLAHVVQHAIAQDARSLDRIFRQLAGELRAQYLIQYYSEADYPQNRFVKLNIGVPQRNDLRVRSREGYYVKNQ